MADFFLTRMGSRFYEATMPGLVRQIERLNENLEKLIASKLEVLPEPPGEAPKSPAEMNNEQVIAFAMKPAKSMWHLDEVQFPRLLAEIRAICLDGKQYADLCKSMDLTEDEIDEILERADKRWQSIKNSM